MPRMHQMSYIPTQKRENMMHDRACSGEAASSEIAGFPKTPDFRSKCSFLDPILRLGSSLWGLEECSLSVYLSAEVVPQGI